MAGRFERSEIGVECQQMTIRTPEIENIILERLAAGETLRAICRADGYPAASTVLLWAQDPLFAERYARARGMGLEVLADEIVEIADDSAHDQIITETGVIQNSEYIARSRLRVDTRKWLLSKLKPDKYGDKLATTISGPDGGAVQVKMELDAAKESLAARIDSIAARLTESGDIGGNTR